MAHGNPGYRRDRRPSDFWEVAWGCGNGFQCDDIGERDIETIYIPETLWSDLPAVHVGAEWEPVSAPSSSHSLPRVVVDPTRKKAALHEGIAQEENAPRISLRWDTSAEVSEDPSSHHRSHHHRKSSRRHIHDSQTHQMPDWHSSARWSGEDAVLSEDAFANVNNSALQNLPTPASSFDRIPGMLHPPRLPVSKGGDAECMPLDDMFDLEPSFGDAATFTFSTLSSGNGSVSTPRRELTRVPCKCPPDQEVVDDQLSMADATNCEASGGGINVEEQRLTEANSELGSCDVSRPQLPQSATFPSLISPHSPSSGNHEFDHAEPAVSLAVSKAEASGGRSRPPNLDAESTVCSDAGGDNRCDEGVSLMSNSSNDTASYADGNSPGALRLPACAEQVAVHERSAPNPPSPKFTW